MQYQDIDHATRILRANPEIGHESIHVAASVGHSTDVARLLQGNASLVHARAGDPAATPLLSLCFSPFHGESAQRDAALLETTRILLDAGADPNTLDGRYGVPALYGVTGMRSVIPIARLLLEHGANPTDGESLFHAAERFHVDALELLRESGADLNHTGEWGNTPLYFLLRWWDVEREPRVSQGLAWLLENGADPNVPCGLGRENSLHVASRRGQSPRVIRLLLDHGADVTARREDGASAWLLARRGSFDEIAALLESAGAPIEPLSSRDALLAACGRGDEEAARRLGSPAVMAELTPEDILLLPEAAAGNRVDTALACVAAGFPVDATDSSGATALHHAALKGRDDLVGRLLSAGARVDLRDREHHSTPLGWTCFGADHVADAEGDYEECARMLIRAGARLQSDEHQPAHAGVRKALDERS